MAKTAMIRARIEPKIKKSAEKVFDKIGMNATEAITIFYRQVALHNGIPFPVRIPNAESRKALKEARSGKLKQYSNKEGFFKDLGI